MSVWQLATTVGGHLGTPNSSLRWLHFCSWMSYPVICRSVERTREEFELEYHVMGVCVM